MLLIPQTRSLQRLDPVPDRKEARIMPDERGPERATVCVTLDFDAASLWMAWGASGARALSRGEFGAKVGAPRLLELFRRLEVPTTWFVPGHTAETYPEMTARITELGHEVGNHGYMHVLDQSSDAALRAELRRANAALKRITGMTPVGMRVPAGEFDGDLFKVLVEEGFTYDSSLIGEFYPSWCRSKDTVSTNGPNVEGEKLDLVELPLTFIVDDFNYFEFNYADPMLVGLCSPDYVHGIWKAQFDYMYNNCPGGIFNITIHPQCTGWGLRAAMLEKLIIYCQGCAGTRFATCGTVAEEFRLASKATE
jgi:peptidoglycan/xylan/chitin deacetylase (PgdA/CDA1 family)